MVARLLVVMTLVLAACANTGPDEIVAGGVTQTDEPTPATLEFIEGDAPGPFELGCLAYIDNGYDYGAGAGSPTMLDEARRVLGAGTWYVDGNRMATFDGDGVATRILRFEQWESGSWVRAGETFCQPGQ